MTEGDHWSELPTDELVEAPNKGEGLQRTWHRPGFWMFNQEVFLAARKTSTSLRHCRTTSLGCHVACPRPHRGLQLAVPEPRSEQGEGGTVCRHDVLGGIIHEYQRAA
jgi:hypothetical protein